LIVILTSTSNKLVNYSAIASSCETEVGIIVSKDVSESFEGTGLNYVSVGEISYECIVRNIHALNLLRNSTSVATVNERYLYLAEALEKQFSNDSSTVVYFRNKYLMRQRAEHLSIPQPTFELLNIKSELLHSGESFVIKPLDESSSRGVEVYIQHKPTLNDFNDERLIESFVDSDMYHIDGLFHNGDHLILSVSKYESGCLSYRESKPLISIMLSPKDEDYNVLKQYVINNFTRFFPNDEIIPYHLEVFYSEDKGIVFGEIAKRPGGGLIVHGIEKAYGVNLSSEYYRLLAGGHPKHYEMKFQTGFALIPHSYLGNSKSHQEVDGVLLDQTKDVRNEESSGSSDWYRRLLVRGFGYQDILRSIQSLI